MEYAVNPLVLYYTIFIPCLRLDIHAGNDARLHVVNILLSETHKTTQLTKLYK